MGILDLYDDRELVSTFGRATFERGQGYVNAGAVLSVEVDSAGSRLTLVHGRVAGSRDLPYDATLTLADDERGGWLDSRCTCPVVRLCKHAVALLLEARDRHGSPATDREWEHRLGLVLEELDEAAEHAARRHRELALQLDLPRPSDTRRRWAAPSSAAGGPRAPGRGALRVRPLVEGARGGWSKAGASWHEVPYLAKRGVDPAQASVLGELLTAHRMATRQMWSGSDSHLSLSAFGSTLWPLLAQVVEAGVAIVPAGALDEVTVHPAAVSLELDVNGADTGQAHVGLGIRIDDDWFAGSRIEVLGETGHGVALWTPVDDERWAVRLARLSRPAGAHLRRMLATDTTLPVPADELGDLVQGYLPRLRRHLPVGSSDASVVVPEVSEPRLVLTVAWKAVDEVRLSWSWRYRVGEDERIYAVDETRGLRGIRRPEAEQALLQDLDLTDEQQHRLGIGPRSADPSVAREGPRPEQTLTGMTAVAFVEDCLVPLEGAGGIEIEEIGARPDYREADGTPVVRFTPRTDPEAEGADLPGARTDWLDLEVVVSLDGRFIGLAQLLEAMTLGAERIILSDGTHLRIDRPEFDDLRALVLAARELEEQPSDAVRISRHDLGLWAELDEIGLVEAQASTWAADWLEAARALSSLDGLPAVEPVRVDAELRAYQLDGLRWLAFLWASRLGGILADDMGLGKTLQTLALVAHARAQAAGPFLVVAPTSVVATWAQEAARFAPHLVVRTVTESRARRGRSLAEHVAGADLVVTSYTLYRLEVDDYVARVWGGLVLDEAQTIKNHQSKTYQAVRRLEAPFRVALTGTPMENRLLDLWSLLSVVAPGLYPYPLRFVETVADPVEKDGDAEVLARFRRRIRPFLLRRTKDLVAADLPPKQEQVLEVQLNPRHRSIYQTHLQRERQHVLGLLGDFDRQRVAIFRSLTRLRQLSLDAGLVDEEYDGVASAKIDVLVDHLLEVTAEGHRALVFSQFTSFLTRVRRRLEAEGITSTYLDGRTRRRADVVAGFKRGEAAVFLISLKAGGVGLTLTEADYVFVLDPWWNPAVEAQAVDRAHRIGQRRPVIVYRLVSTDTVEEKVMALKARKAALFSRVLDGGGGMGTPIDADDVRELLAD